VVSGNEVRPGAITKVTRSNKSLAIRNFLVYVPGCLRPKHTIPSMVFSTN
jgi:hypothetical protein